jgi:hypothetical protein
LELQLWLDLASKDVVVVVALPTPSLLCHAWSSFILSAFTSSFFKILSFVWLFGATKIYNNLEKLLEIPSCAFVVFLLLSSAWIIGSGGCIKIYMWHASLFSLILYTYVSSMFKFHNCGIFLNFIVFANLI